MENEKERRKAIDFGREGLGGNTEKKEQRSEEEEEGEGGEPQKQKGGNEKSRGENYA